MFQNPVISLFTVSPPPFLRSLVLFMSLPECQCDLKGTLSGVGECEHVGIFQKYTHRHTASPYTHQCLYLTTLYLQLLVKLLFPPWCVATEKWTVSLQTKCVQPCMRHLQRGILPAAKKELFWLSRYSFFTRQLVTHIPYFAETNISVKRNHF